MYIMVVPLPILCGVGCFSWFWHLWVKLGLCSVLKHVCAYMGGKLDGTAVTCGTSLYMTWVSLTTCCICLLTLYLSHFTHLRTCHLQKYRSLSHRSCSTRFCTLMKSGSASIQGVLCRRWSLRTVRLKRCGTGCRKFWRRLVSLTSGRPVRLSSVMLLWVISRHPVKLHLSPNTSLPLYLGEFSSWRPSTAGNRCKIYKSCSNAFTLCAVMSWDYEILAPLPPSPALSPSPPSPYLTLLAPLPHSLPTLPRYPLLSPLLPPNLPWNSWCCSCFQLCAYSYCPRCFQHRYQLYWTANEDYCAVKLFGQGVIGCHIPDRMKDALKSLRHRNLHSDFTELHEILSCN